MALGDWFGATRPEEVRVTHYDSVIGLLTVVHFFVIALVALSTVVVATTVGIDVALLYVVVIVSAFAFLPWYLTALIAGAPLVWFLTDRTLRKWGAYSISWSVEGHVKEIVEGDVYHNCPDTLHECFDQEGVEIPEWAEETIVVPENIADKIVSKQYDETDDLPNLIKLAEADMKLERRKLRKVKPSHEGRALTWLVTEGKVLFPNAKASPEMLIAVRLKLASIVRDPSNGLNVRNKDVLRLTRMAATRVLIPDKDDIFEAQMLKSFTAQEANAIVDLSAPSWWIKMVRWLQGSEFQRVRTERGRLASFGSP
nr:hypothetical protein [Tolivirales sp.]